MQPIRQGDVILTPVEKTEGQKKPHLTLAEGEVTGHSHRIIGPEIAKTLLANSVQDLCEISQFTNKAIENFKCHFISSSLLT
ncbi:hypothetical protein [Phormidium nigroviride]